MFLDDILGEKRTFSHFFAQNGPSRFGVIFTDVLDDILGKKRTFSLKISFSELFRFGRPKTSINTDETKGRCGSP